MFLTKQILSLLSIAVVFLSSFNCLTREDINQHTFRLENVIDVAVSPLGDKFAVAQENIGVSIWSSIDYQLLSMLEVETAIYAHTLGWSSDGSLVAVSSDEGVYLWDVNSGSLVQTLNGHPVDPIDEIDLNQDYIKRVENLSFSPVNHLLATSNRLDRAVLLWDARSGQVFHTLYTHEDDSLQAVEFSPNGEFIAARLMSSIKIWNVQTGEMLRDFKTATDTMAFSPNSMMIASGFGRLTSEIVIWNIDTGQQLDSMRIPLSVNNLLWTYDSNQLLANSTSSILVSDGIVYVDGAIHLWEISSGDVQAYDVLENPFSVELDSQEVLIGIGVGQIANEALVWDMQLDEIYRRNANVNIDEAIFEHEDPLAFTLSPDENFLVFGTNRGLIAAVNMQTGDQQVIQARNMDRIVQISWLSDRIFATLSADKVLLLWDSPE